MGVLLSPNTYVCLFYSSYSLGYIFVFTLYIYVVSDQNQHIETLSSMISSISGNIFCPFYFQGKKKENMKISYYYFLAFFGCLVSKKVVGPNSLNFPLGLVFLIKTHLRKDTRFCRRLVFFTSFLYN